MFKHLKVVVHHLPANLVIQQLLALGYRKILGTQFLAVLIDFGVLISVVDPDTDPDPVGSEIICRIRIRTRNYYFGSVSDNLQFLVDKIA